MVGFTPAGRVEQFFRDLDARGTYFGAGTNEDREAARQRYGIVTSDLRSRSRRDYSAFFIVTSPTSPG